MSAIRWQASRLMCTAGTRNFIATCAAILPSRTCRWIASGCPKANEIREPMKLGPSSHAKSGFTLIELSITIAVILILAGAASLGIKPYYAFRDGRAAGDPGRA